MKKGSITVLLIVMVVALTLTGCAKKESPTLVAVADVSYSDGIYFAVDSEFDSAGWKDVVTLEVKNGKIIRVEWNAVNINAGADKKSYDKAGKYNMVAYGKAQAEWYEQAARVEAHVIKTQNPLAVRFKDSDGHTDDIAGVSIQVQPALELMAQALAAGVVGRGPYQDGAYFAIEQEWPDSGWKEYVGLTVINGYIVAVDWNGINKQGDLKKLYDKAGKYNMVAYGKAQAEWYQQAERAENYLLQTQDTQKIRYTDAEGATDDIAGVSIHVAPFFTLSEKALQGGPIQSGPYTDGGYYAEASNFDEGWKGVVSLLVSNGNIANVYWSGLNVQNEDKKEYDMAGKYNMVAYGKAQAEWYEQAEKAEEYLVATQQVKQGNQSVDDVSGVSINLSEFYTLVAQALAKGPKK